MVGEYTSHVQENNKFVTIESCKNGVRNLLIVGNTALVRSTIVSRQEVGSEITRLEADTPEAKRRNFIV